MGKPECCSSMGNAVTSENPFEWLNGENNVI